VPRTLSDEVLGKLHAVPNPPTPSFLPSFSRTTRLSSSSSLPLRILPCSLEGFYQSHRRPVVSRLRALAGNIKKRCIPRKAFSDHTGSLSAEVALAGNYGPLTTLSMARA
ncbi:hypothetical protein RUND412_011289, partial [Rhizina undulata]